MNLSRNESSVLKFLKNRQDSKRIAENEILLPELSSREISSSVSWLQKKGLITVETEYTDRILLGNEGKTYLNEGLPEYKVLNFLKHKKEARLGDLFEVFGKEEASIALTQLAKLGLKPKEGRISYHEDPAVIEEIESRQKALVSLSNGDSNLDQKVLENLKARGDLLETRKLGKRFVSLTPEGRSFVLHDSTEKSIEEIDSKIILSGEWKISRFREYDLSSPVETFRGASVHPITNLINRVKKIFLELGFSEIRGHYIEYAGWNMDALFIPQHHPARDLQDTFYVDVANKPEFESPEILPKVKKSHERGIPGYSGWKYQWDEAEARRTLLRTHTTVNTIRYLYNHREPPVAVFSIEKAFRHESVDWKHLAELHQIEGVFYGKDANISTLKWLIREFYSKLGFNEIKLIPSYYPYTEPSMDVVAVIDGKEVEMGGSGLFRPEVTVPMGLREPVIAWGLGLERLAMLFYGIKDIREIYNSDLEWLQTYRFRY
ncbi:MAG: phenylalanine--tRNA ligase subunit alpha [Thermoplasmatales archaeon B_DKE]|nr:MAG: phenylalanine--tRNA ligase subunit alpha [Thermoplasmatales archaeon B_DKE]